MSLASLAKVYEFYTSCSSFASTCTTIAKVQVVDDKKSTIDAILDKGLTPVRYLFGGKNVAIDNQGDVHRVSSYKAEGKSLESKTNRELKAEKKKSGFWGTAFKVGMVALLVVGAAALIFKLGKYAATKNEKQQKAVTNAKPLPQDVGSPTNILSNTQDVISQLKLIAKTGKISTLTFYTSQLSRAPILPGYGIRSWQKIIVPKEAFTDFCSQNQVKDMATKSFKTLAEAKSFSTASRFAFWSKPAKAIVSYETVK